MIRVGIGEYECRLIRLQVFVPQTLITLRNGLYFGKLQGTRTGTLVQRATPAISDGMIFIRGQKHLFAIAEKAAPKEAAAK